jgi:hypothetical protein
MVVFENNSTYMGVICGRISYKAAIVKMGGPTCKITKIALNNLGTWLELQMPMSMVRNM